MGYTLITTRDEEPLENYRIEEFEINFESGPLNEKSFAYTVISNPGVFIVFALWIDGDQSEIHELRRFHRFDDKKLGAGFNHQNVIEYLQSASCYDDTYEAFQDSFYRRS